MQGYLSQQKIPSFQETETCNYQNIDFLKFLLSKEGYIQKYVERYTPSGNSRKYSGSQYAKVTYQVAAVDARAVV